MLHKSFFNKIFSLVRKTKTYLLVKLESNSVNRTEGISRDFRMFCILDVGIPASLDVLLTFNVEVE